MADRKMAFRQLAVAEEYVARGLEIIAHQKKLIAELERDGHESAAATARRILETLLQSQALHESERDRLKHGLNSLE